MIFGLLICRTIISKVVALKQSIARLIFFKYFIILQIKNMSFFFNSFIYLQSYECTFWAVFMIRIKFMNDFQSICKRTGGRQKYNANYSSFDQKSGLSSAKVLTFSGLTTITVGSLVELTRVSRKDISALALSTISAAN